MDYRLYILAGSFLFLLVSLVLLLVAMVRSRRSPQQPEPAPAESWPMLNPAPQEIDERIRETFAEPTTGVAAVLNEPIRTGAWQPETPRRTLRTDGRADYWDALVDEPTQLVRDDVPSPPAAPAAGPAVAETAPAGVTKPSDEAAPEPVSEPTPTPRPDAAITPQPAPAPTTTPMDSRPETSVADEGPVKDVAAVVERATQDAEIDHLIEELVEPAASALEGTAPAATQADAGESEPTPEPTPPSAPSSPTPPSVPASTRSQDHLADDGEGEVAPDMTPPLEFVSPANGLAVSAVTPPTAPRPASVPSPPPAAGAASVEVAKAEAPAPPAPPQARPAPAAPPVSATEPEPRPKTASPARTARVTGVSAQGGHAAPGSDVPSARRQAPLRDTPRATVAAESPEKVPDHELVAPVEMWFGEDRVGVKPGSRTYDLFQKYAAVLFDDLKRSTRSTLV
jgi:hypothetical protein